MSITDAGERNGIPQQSTKYKVEILLKAGSYFLSDGV